MAEKNLDGIEKPSIKSHEISSLDADYPRNSLYSNNNYAENDLKLSQKPTIKQNTVSNQIADGLKNVVDTVLWPSLKRTLSTMLKQMIDVLIDPGKTLSREKDSVYRSYDSPERFGGYRSLRKNGITIDDFATKEDAQKVIRWLRIQIAANGKVSLGYLYDYLGESKRSTSLDFDRVWYDVDDVSVVRTGNSWSLELPEPR